MTMRRKHYGIWRCILTVTFMAILIVGFVDSAGQAAEKYPSRPIRIYVPWSLGGSTDYMARALQPFLKEVLGAPAVIVVNKPGGRSLVGVGAFAREKADGYSIMIDDAASMGVAYLWTDKPPFDWNDFTALTQLLLDPRYMFVKKDSPYKDMNDFVEDARKSRGGYRFPCRQDPGPIG
jgi:tripartite-type tricarboxylate transporter receptor subunit TctC